MSKSPKRTKSYKWASVSEPSEVNEPQAVYARKVTPPSTRKPAGRKGYDAKRSAGMLPGIAERLKEYLKTLRDGR